jgi:hypothetical protein
MFNSLPMAMQQWSRVPLLAPRPSNLRRPPHPRHQAEQPLPSRKWPFVPQQLAVGGLGLNARDVSALPAREGRKLELCWSSPIRDRTLRAGSRPPAPSSAIVWRALVVACGGGRPSTGQSQRTTRSICYLLALEAQRGARREARGARREARGARRETRGARRVGHQRPQRDSSIPHIAAPHRASPHITAPRRATPPRPARIAWPANLAHAATHRR